MKISYISKTNTWHDEQITKEAKNYDLELEKLDIENLNDFEKLNSLGDLILWRSSSLSIPSGRATLLSILDRDEKIIINRSIIDFPAVFFKQFQQEYIKKRFKNINTIPTFTFLDKKTLLEALKSGRLKFPMIKKPNLGSKGEGIKLIKDDSDLKLLQNDDIKESIFQNFIENDGDYRVLVIGGQPVDIIKRTGAKDSFLNNVSMGGDTSLVTDEKLRTELFEISAQIASSLNLGFCGVDIIQDKNTKKLYFLELNTVPQWQGFQKCTGINVAQKLIEYVQSMLKRKNKKVSKLVKDCYTKNAEQLASKKFHFFTRMFLWTQNKEYLDELSKLKSDYFGENVLDFEEKIKTILNEKDIYQKKVHNKKDFRLDTLKKYPLLGSYSEILFRNLMSKNIFNVDLRESIQKMISDKDLVSLREKLLKNPEDILTLSTFALNYIYFLEDYFEGDATHKVDVSKLLTLTQTKEFANRGKNRDLLINDVYFITHALIGASKFYKQKITKDRENYLELFGLLEKIVDKYYLALSLDTKLELLICAQLLDTSSKFEDRILQEAEFSLSPINNFLVDTFNIQKNKTSKSWIDSEHRNVLYIMLNS